MSTSRELPEPVDLPDGTLAIVKVQWPAKASDNPVSWMVFAQGYRHIRLYKPERMPAWVSEALGQKIKGYFHAKVHAQEWIIESVAEDQKW